MKRKWLAVGLFAALSISGVVMFSHLFGESSSAVPAAPSAVAAAPSADGVKPSMSYDTWLEKRAAGDSELPSAPPHVQTVLSSFGLSVTMWDHYLEQSAEELDKRLGELKTEFAALQAETTKLRDRHSALAQGGSAAEADKIMRDEVMPLFDSRDKLLGETLLVVNAKSIVSGVAPDMPAEMLAR